MKPSRKPQAPLSMRQHRNPVLPLCSSWVLASLGLLAAVAPLPGQAQGAGGSLAAGTVPVLRGVVSGQAVMQAPRAVPGGQSLRVEQTSDRAVLSWETFNIARGSDLTIYHPSTTAATLNRIYGNDPSIVQGALKSRLWDPATRSFSDNKAGGQIVLVNQNGILFDRGAQVNASGLIASTLNIADSRFLSGVLSSATEAAFEGGYDDAGKPLATRPNGTRSGNIGIGSFGPASAAAPLIEVTPGGALYVFAPRVDNDSGVLRAPDGQIIMAAGKKVFLTQNPNATDITLRGLVVEVQAEDNGTSAGLSLSNLVRNAGELSADRGNVSLAALAVNQEGRISARTAVQASGSVYLTGRALAATGVQAGQVTLAAGSLTEVTPDTADRSTVAESADYRPFRGVVDIRAGKVASSGSVLAPGGRILLTASDEAEPSQARVYLADGSLTSVAGHWADVDFAKSLVSFRVTSNELKNAPDQKNGLLRGATVTVDLRRDHNILALDGYRDNVLRTVAEKAALGGELVIRSSGDIVQRAQATLDASGGGYRYDSGTVSTSRLLGADGRVYDIATAPQALRYVAQLDRFDRVDARFNETTSYSNLLGAVASFQPAYVQGLGAGAIDISSSHGLVLDGVLKGGVTIGSEQLARAPLGATLRLGTGFNATGNYNVGQRIGNIEWRQVASDTLGSGFDLGSALDAAHIDKFTLAASQVFGAAQQVAGERREAGFGTVELNSDGRISVPAGVSLQADALASMVFNAQSMDIAGRISLPAGSLLLRPLDSPNDVPAPAGPTLSERLVLRTGAAVSVAGAWVNNASRDGRFIGDAAPSARLNAAGTTTASVLNGGAITVQIGDQTFQTRMERGSSLDVSGGGALSGSQRLTAGNGGRLVLSNGNAAQSTSDWMQADLQGHALGNGGELTFNLNRALIEANGANGTLPADTTRLEARLFDEQGFSKVSVNALFGIELSSGTQLRVRQDNFVLDLQAASTLTTGANLRSVAAPQTLPDHQRTAASVSLSGGTVTVPENAGIRTDARGQITLQATDALRIGGQLEAPGGSLTLAVRGPDNLASQGLTLEPSARLSAAGTFVQTPLDSGLTQGTLHNAGSVTLSAAQAGVNMQAGAMVDVSARNQRVDIGTGDSAPGFQEQTLVGHAGTVLVRSQGAALLGGTFRAQGGGEGAAGGSFALEFTRPDGQSTLAAQRRIVVQQGSVAAPDAPASVTTTLDSAALAGAGFDKLRLLAESRIELQGSGTLNFARGLRLDAPVIDVLGESRVTLQGANVALGQSIFRGQTTDSLGRLVWGLLPELAPRIAARAGLGLLNIDAGNVDFFGGLTLGGMQLTQVHSQADVRFIGRAVNKVVPGIDREFRQIGWLQTAGSLEIQAGQIYPATRTGFSVDVAPSNGSEATSPYLLVRNNGQPAGGVYSVAGSLSLSAPTIVNLGTIRAPEGELKLVAGKLLELGNGSITSVSGEGTTALYGTTLAGLNWQYADGGLTAPSDLTRVSGTGKRIELQGPQQTVAAGARVDLRGGGDVLAVEFVPGNGGDRDITLADNTYAIVPSARLAAMPFDADLQARKDLGFGFAVGAGRDTVLYDGLAIGGGSGVPAGSYALLPARYALLPDAYLVQVQTGSAYRNLQPGQTAALANGDVVSVGHRLGLGTDVRESQSVGVVVLPGAAAVRRSSDYTLSGSALFAQVAERERNVTPAAPWDAGRLLIAGANSLELAGRFETGTGTSASATPARAAQVDIEARKVAVVGTVGADTLPADFLQVSSGAISGFNASVLIGGRRTDVAEGTRITTTAQELRVANNTASAVELPELLLVSRGSIDIAAGSVLRATGAAAPGVPSVILSESSGALLRLSSGEQTNVDRGVTQAGTGDVRIGDGALVSASGSLMVDATRSTESTGQLRAGGTAGGGALSLSSGRLSLGQTDAATAPLSGLVLSNADLAAYATLDALVLRGYQGIDLLGASVLGTAALKRLTLDTPLLRGVAGPTEGPQASLQAQALTLVNGTGTLATTGGGSGSLLIRAETLTLGAGDVAVSGFGHVGLQADTALRTQDVGALRSAVALSIETPLVQTGSAAAHRIVALDEAQPGGPVHATVTLSGSANAAPAASAVSETAPAPGLGGRLSIEGSNIRVDTTVQARSGRIELKAVAPGEDASIVLAPSALLDATGQLRDFRGTRVVADGGSVSLSAVGGGIDLQQGSRVAVSAFTGTDGTQAGDAGRLSLLSQTLQLGGQIEARSAEGSRSGSVALDLGRMGEGSMADFSTLNTALNSGGFGFERQVRLRSGDLLVAGDDKVDAHKVSLTADSGRIDVAGTVGQGSAQGGANITLNAATGLTLAAGSELLAQGSQTGARGGEVRAGTRAGALVFEEGATIDVRAGNAGPAGSVVLGVGRDAAGMNPAQLNGRVRRHSSAGDSVATVDLEATRVIDADQTGSSVTAAQIAAWGGEHAQFVAASGPAAAGLLAGLRDDTGTLSGARVLGALEVQAAGNLSLDANWDLTTGNWLAAGLPGTLSVRAAANLVLRETLGAPRLATSGTNVATNNLNQNTNHAIRAGDTWNIRLTAGADLGSSDALATASVALPATAAGDLLLTGANANIRTGTGRIDLAAARHVQMDNINSAIYTGGRIGAADAEVNGNNRWAIDGGNISIRAGGNVAGPQNTRDLWITEWLRRPRLGETGPAGFGVANPTDWWSYRPRFQQAVGTLAGGNIDIRAGGDLLEFSAMLPTSGRTSGTVAAGTRDVQVTGGGDLSVQVGGSLVGGGFLVGRGEARVEAGGSIGKAQPVQLYVMGASSGALREGATVELNAGGDLALKSVDNPTVLFMNPSNGAAGPSFHPTIATNTNDNPPSTFFTYAANSAVGVLSKGGDVSFDFGIASATTAAASWRNQLGAAVTAGFAQPNAATAYPPLVSMVAMDGSLRRSSGEAAFTFKTYPSPSGAVALLARESVAIPSLVVSDLDPAELITPRSRFANARLSTSTLSAPFDVGATTGKRRIVTRDSSLPFTIDSRDATLPDYLAEVQALEGNISSNNADSALFVIPAVSRIRAGQDIVSTQAVLQNLLPEDLSEIRADSGDVRSTAANGQILIGGPGRLLVQAGRNIDRGSSVINTLGASSNPQLAGNGNARLTLIAGVTGDVDLAKLDAGTTAGGRSGVYGELVDLNRVSQDILDLYAQLGAESGSRVLNAASVASLAAQNPAYTRFVGLDALPRVLATFQAALREDQLPLAAGVDRDSALSLYRLLNTESDVGRLRNAGSLVALAQSAGGAAYQSYIGLATRFPLLYADYVQRRSEGALPTALAPIVFSNVLNAVVAQALPAASVGQGSIFSFGTNVQTGGSGGIDLLAPGGDVVVGLTTPAGSNTIGVLTTGGGGIGSILKSDFNVNQGKVITAQGGDILLFSASGSIDAGRGAKTSSVTAPPTITRDASGRATVTFSGAATGSGIQSLSSDPDGLGPLAAPAPGNVYLFAPAGSIDAGEAGIRSSGNILINAQVVRNASDIRASGSSQGVPQLQIGSLATALASSNSGGSGSKAAEDGARAATEAAKKAAAAPPPPKPTILTVEVMGFGDKNCKEDDKECFAK